MARQRARLGGDRRLSYASMKLQTDPGATAPGGGVYIREYVNPIRAGARAGSDRNGCRTSDHGVESGNGRASEGWHIGGLRPGRFSYASMKPHTMRRVSGAVVGPERDPRRDPVPSPRPTIAAAVRTGGKRGIRITPVSSVKLHAGAPFV